MIEVVIVNYRTAELTIDCLASLEVERDSTKPLRVVVTDNASPDDSVDVIARAIDANGWGDWVTLMPLERNGGFAYGNNRAIETIDLDDTDYIVLLNPDTIVRAGAMVRLVAFMDDQAEAGVAGSRLENRDGTPQNSAFRFHSIWSELEAGAKTGPISRLLGRWRVPMGVRDEPHEADWVAGACMIIRPEVIRQVGLMDERYFMYFEEVDYCRRVKEAGWSVWYVPEARVVHLVGKSSGIGDADVGRRRKPAYWFASRQWYFRKNHGRFGAVMVNAARLVGQGIWAISRRLRGQRECDPPRFVRDLLSHAWRDPGGRPSDP